MGRIGTDDADAPPHSHEDLYGPPPSDYQPAVPEKKKKQPPQDHPEAQAFPPPEDDSVHAFPPNILTAQQQQQQQYPNGGQQFIPPQAQPVFYPQPAAPVINPQLNQQPWKTHLFDCMKDPTNAIITLFCPCVTFGQIAEILDSGSTSCATSGMIYSLIACCIAMPCIMSCTYRSKLRSRFGLTESPVPDCLVHCFCEYCALCQEYRELQERGLDPSIGWLGNVAKQQQFGMTPPMHQRMM